MYEEASSEPVATAFDARPAATLTYAYLNAVIPERQMPEVVTASQAGIPSSPCTMRPWPGNNRSGLVVPQHRH